MLFWEKGDSGGIVPYVWNKFKPLSPQNYCGGERLFAGDTGLIEGTSLSHGVGSGLGYAWILVAVGFVRELFGAGTLLCIQVIPDVCYEWGYANNGMMTMHAMALIIVGCIIWATRAINDKK